MLLHGIDIVISILNHKVPQYHLLYNMNKLQIKFTISFTYNADKNDLLYIINSKCIFEEKLMCRKGQLLKK